MRLATCVATFGAITLATACAVQAQTKLPSSQQHTRAIYNLLLDDPGCGGTQKEGRHNVLVSDQFATLESMGLAFPDLGEWGANFVNNQRVRLRRDVGEATVDAFFEVNRRSGDATTLIRSLGAGVYTRADEAAIVKAGEWYWDGFRQRFPRSDGLTALGRIGFNAERSEALAYCARTSGMLAGDGRVAVLRRVHGRWSIVRWETIWVS